MLEITLSPQIYHHHQQFLFKFKENNENDMTFCHLLLFWLVLFLAHVYGRSQLVVPRSLSNTMK